MYSVLMDPKMKNGFQISSTVDHTPDKAEEKLNFFSPQDTASPDWRIVQWWSKKNLIESKVIYEDNAAEIKDETKKVSVEFDESGISSITLGLKGSLEFSHPRRDGEVWPHLGFEQEIAHRNMIGKIKNLNLSFGLTINSYKKKMAEEDFDELIHGAMFGVGFVVSNLNEKSKDFRDFFWLQHRLYDERFTEIPPYIAIDGGKEGASDKLIYSPGSKGSFEPIRKGVESKLFFDICPSINAGLEEAKKRGCLVNSSIEDMAIVFFGFSWELFGAFDVECTVRDLSLTAEEYDPEL